MEHREGERDPTFPRITTKVSTVPKIETGIWKWPCKKQKAENVSPLMWLYSVTRQRGHCSIAHLTGMHAGADQSPYLHLPPWHLPLAPKFAVRRLILSYLG